MQAFTQHTGIAAPLLRINIDTDAIIPSREMKTVSKKGLAPGLFAGWRYTDAAKRAPNPEFVLNQPAYAGCSILLGGNNFGCGSSREHAVWALAEYGIRCIIAPSFGVIFQNNCVRNGLLPLVLDEASIRNIADQIANDPQQDKLVIDLEKQVLTSPDGADYAFSIDPGARQMLLEGLDAIGATLQHQARIDSHIKADRQTRPWAHAPKNTAQQQA